MTDNFESMEDNLKLELPIIGRKLVKNYIKKFSKLKMVKFKIKYLNLDKILDDFEYNDVFLDNCRTYHYYIKRHPEFSEKLIKTNIELKENSDINDYLDELLLEFPKVAIETDSYELDNILFEGYSLFAFNIPLIKVLLAAGVNITKYGETDDQDELDSGLSVSLYLKLFQWFWNYCNQIDNTIKTKQKLNKEISLIPGGKSAEDAKESFQELGEDYFST